MTGNLAGFRLSRIELCNWGTFDEYAWQLAANGQNTLLTGDIGAGKSTIVDAVTTLLLPANRISYNKAAGAEVSERSLRSYVLGYYKSERNEVTGAAKPVPLRDGSKVSVILGVFRNEGYDETVTLAQVFWMRDADAAGQPDRFYLTADRALSIADDFRDFGADITALRRRLRGGGGILVHDAFPEYGKDFRRRLGIESLQAMDLFHQTVSMKAVGNLTDFVREHMLEPFDAAKAVQTIVGHFENLTRAHEAVRRIRSQLAQLTPLLADCDAHDKVAAQIAALCAQRAALRYYFADAKAGLLSGLLTGLGAERSALEDRLGQLAQRLRDLRNIVTSLEMQRAGHGGSRLAEIERQIEETEAIRARQSRAERFGLLLSDAGLGPVETADQFAARSRQIAAVRESARQDLADSQDLLMKAQLAKQDLDTEAADVNAELRSLQERKNNIPKRQLDLRSSLCRDLRLAPDALPFAGELIAVRETEADWEGAAERLLRSFALSLLVPETCYRAVSDWIDRHQRGRLVYYRVPDLAAAARVPPPGAATLAAKLEIKDTPFASWLARELARRADAECVPALAEFRGAGTAITMAGQVKGGARHEKDDRYRIDDRRRYVLGWSTERKTGALLERARTLSTRNAKAEADLSACQQAVAAAIEHRGICLALDQTRDFAEIDWQSAVNKIADLRVEHAKLTAASAGLIRLDTELVTVKQEITLAEGRHAAVSQALGGVSSKISDAEAEQGDTRLVLAEPQCEAGRRHFASIRDLLAKAGHEPGRTAAACDKAEAAAAGEIVDLMNKRNDRRTRLSNRIVGAMGEFRRQHPDQTGELDDAVESASGYRELRRRLAEDDLPRFRQQFKTYLNQNMIRDIAAFQSQLSKQAELISQQIDTINVSLVDVDYNPGRYIKLQAEPTPHQEIKDFRAELRACADDPVQAGGDGGDRYSEQKFLQVANIIERFRGRDGHSGADRRWTRFVTDVRNWYLFSASERLREDNREYEHYTDSAGKSGGQKEKLAYTILAASLACQFKLEWGATTSKTFQFAVIDEAFGRGSDSSTRFALELFGKLGLQLLIVAPLQKIHVIEPYVSAVGFVDNPTSRFSRLRTLAIEEYRAEREVRVQAASLVTVA